MDFAVSAIPKWKSKKEERERQVLRPCQKTKEAVEHKNDSATSCNWHAWNSPQRTGKRAGGVGNQRLNQDYPDYSIAENGKNTKGSGYLKRLVVTQTPVKDHQLTLEWKTFKK